MVSIELGKEIEEDVFRLVTSMGQRKNSEYPRGIKLRCSTTEPQRLYDERDILRSSYDTRPEYR